MEKEETRQRQFEEIKKGIVDFSQQNLSDEYAGYALRLLERLGRKKSFFFDGETTGLWASAIIHVIARINHLFSKNKSKSLPREAICEFFGTSQSDVLEKACHIERTLDIQMGDKELCNPNLSGSLTFIEFSSGMIVSENQAKELDFLTEE
ncbi:MAG: DUF6398 domain-containing protein [Desulfatiglans sp.]|nr:DUF6398 domain-containing protein [Thermodesulfobacteriota bacterium]MEE4354534.1 DUF6398 domain-containing protein [Desulfatiglans sp.]